MFETIYSVCTSAIYGRVMTQLSADENGPATGARLKELHHVSAWCQPYNTQLCSALHCTTVHCTALQYTNHIVIREGPASRSDLTLL